MPPFVGTAVNVTDVPAHTGLEDAVTSTLTGSDGLMVMVADEPVKPRVL